MGIPRTLHKWWARRPLAAARAVIFAQMVDDPSAHPEKFPTEESAGSGTSAALPADRGAGAMGEHHERTVLAQAREEILEELARHVR